MLENFKSCISIHKKTAHVVAIIFVVLVLALMGLKVMKDIQVLDKTDNAIDQKTISVSGKGEKLVTPDIATVSLGATKESTTVLDAQSKVTAKMNATMDALKAMGIDKKDIKSIGYDISPRYEYVKVAPVDDNVYYPSGKQVLAGYTVTQTIEVKIRNIDKAGEILAKVGEIGLTNVSGLNFSVDKQDEIKLSARAEAIDDAKNQAKVLADQLGVRLGRLVSFSDNSYYPSLYARSDMKVTASSYGAAAAPEIAPGESKITSNVTLVYEIK